VDCGLGNKHQQSEYSIRKTYVHVGGLSRDLAKPALRGVQGPRSRWTPRAGCGLSHRHQQGVYTTCKTYVHGEGSSRGPNKPARRGMSSRSWRHRARTVGWATGISKPRTTSIKRTYMEGGRRGVLTSLRGRGGVQGPGDAARGLWVGQQVLASTYSIFKTYLRGEGSRQGPSEPAGRGKSPRSRRRRARTVGWATAISKARTAFVNVLTWKVVRRGSERACEEGEESKVLTSRWTPRAGCGLGNRHQQSVYRTCKTYVHGGGSSRVPNEPAREGRSPRSQRADGRRARAGQQVSAKHDSTCKMYVHGGGSSRGPNEPAGSGRLESRWTARAGCGLGNRH
jgi:hypothetical protein